MVKGVIEQFDGVKSGAMGDVEKFEIKMVMLAVMYSRSLASVSVIGTMSRLKILQLGNFLAGSIGDVVSHSVRPKGADALAHWRRFEKMMKKFGLGKAGDRPKGFEYLGYEAFDILNDRNPPIGLLAWGKPSGCHIFRDC